MRDGADTPNRPLGRAGGSPENRRIASSPRNHRPLRPFNRKGSAFTGGASDGPRSQKIVVRCSRHSKSRAASEASHARARGRRRRRDARGPQRPSHPSRDGGRRRGLGARRTSSRTELRTDGGAFRLGDARRGRLRARSPLAGSRARHRPSFDGDRRNGARRSRRPAPGDLGRLRRLSLEAPRPRHDRQRGRSGGPLADGAATGPSDPRRLAFSRYEPRRL